MALPTVVINKSKVKFRFAEPYTSEASNFQTGINDIGVYRGGLVEVGGTPYKSLEMSTDGTATVVLHRNSDGYGTVINETSKITFDLESAVTWPIAAGGLQLYIYLAVDYAVDAETTALWGICESGDLPADSVRIAMIDLAEGASRIYDTDIHTDGSTNRAKVLGKKGIIVPKIADVGTGSSRARFMIADRVCCLGSTPTLDDPRAVMLLNNAAPSFPLTDSTSTDSPVLPYHWYAASSGGTYLTVSDMDEDGCYTNPYIQFSTGTYDGAFKVAYYAFVTLDSIDTTEDMHGFVWPHASQIKSSSIVGTDETVAAGLLPVQLLSMLNMITGKIDAINPDAAASTWTLLWRSNNITLDSLVDDNTLSIYYNYNGILIAKGGYIDGTDFKATSYLTASTMFAHSIVDNMRVFRYATGTGPLTKGLSTTSDWTYYDSDNTYENRIYNYERNVYLDQACKVEMSGVPNVSPNEKYIEILRAAESELRVYYSAANNDSSLIICSGCYWYDAGDLWKRVTTATRNAFQMSIGRSGGMSFRNKDKDDADFATGWEDTDSDWTRIWQFGDSVYPFFRTQGEVMESAIVPFKVVLNSSYVAAMAYSGTWLGPTVHSVMNFKSYRNATISPSDFTYSKNGSGATVTGLVASDISEWGCKVSGAIDITSYLTDIGVVSVSSPATIVVTGAGFNWMPGQIVCVRGSGYNKVFRITDWSESTDTTLTIDTGGDADVGTGSALTLYTVFPEDENEEIEAFYLAQVF